jgi:ornithine cyclodeaminase/alanine dehydrogenase-like protein (mu-crystallin family)
MEVSARLVLAQDAVEKADIVVTARSSRHALFEED